jgi:triacylglycerol esterase/lipase EstA (alpha/beta hydrolase family)
MLSRLVRLAIVAELLAYGALGAWLVQARGWSLLLVIAAALTACLGARLGFTVASFILSRHYASQRPEGTALPAGATFAMILREFRAVLGSNFVGVPFPALVTPPERAPIPTDRIPVILVHGYFGNRGFFGALLRHFEAAGVAPVFAPDFPATFATIEDFAEALDREIERIATATGQPRVVLVCHSMGGLATRRYLANRGPGRIAKVVTIASPHGGTVLSRLGLGANAAQMRRGCAFIADLRHAETAGAPCLFTSIYSLDDNMVTPQDTSCLDWSRNVPLAGVGHITILQTAATFEALMKELREAGVQTAG